MLYKTSYVCALGSQSVTVIKNIYLKTLYKRIFVLLSLFSNRKAWIHRGKATYPNYSRQRQKKGPIHTCYPPPCFPQYITPLTGRWQSRRCSNKHKGSDSRPESRAGPCAAGAGCSAAGEEQGALHQDKIAAWLGHGR